MSLLACAIDKLNEYLGEQEAAFYKNNLRAFSKLKGADHKLKELSHSKKLEFFDLLKEVDYALIFKGLGFDVEVEPDSETGIATMTDLRVRKDGRECFVEVTTFRPKPNHKGPPEFNEETYDILLEYGNPARDTEKAAQKILNKCGQLGSRTSILAIWNDDQDLEELEVESAVNILAENGQIPDGLQFVLYGSYCIKGKKQFHCYPTKQMAPVFQKWKSSLESNSANKLIKIACRELDHQSTD